MSGTTADFPDQESLKAYVKAAADCAGVFQAISTKSQLPVPDSDRTIDLTIERNCMQLRKVMLFQIAARFALESKDTARWERMLHDGEGRYIRREDYENDFDAAVALLCGCILSVNMLARIYYERFPTCEPLFTVIRRLTELSPPALRTVFGDSLPDAVRESWPHFIGLYEVYCRHHTING